MNELVNFLRAVRDAIFEAPTRWAELIQRFRDLFTEAAFWDQVWLAILAATILGGFIWVMSIAWRIVNVFDNIFLTLILTILVFAFVTNSYLNALLLLMRAVLPA
ncbi:MAG TPA: hypothetical protein VNM40_03735 [Candidatus Paceibacterota bacterium]|nr:hypothetical protein [Candidatus Paceibacterota bacterium]